VRRGSALLLAVVSLALGAACDSEEPGRTGTATTIGAATTSAAPGVTPGSGFLAPDRVRLSICVDEAAGGTVPQEHVSDVSEALEDAASDLGESDWALKYLEPAVVIPGCPPATVPIGVRLANPHQAYDYAVRVPAASEHRLFVYFIGEDAYEATFGEVPYVEAAAEMLCTGDNCGEVTTGLYVPSDIGADDLQQGLLDGLGIIDPYEGRTPSS